MPKIISVLLFVLLLPAISAFSQTIPRIHRSLHFRIYGKEARPVSEKAGYKIKVEKEKLEESQEKNFYRSHTLHINENEIQVKGFPAEFAIEKGKKSMRIESSFSLDSVPFTTGDFLFPDCYSGLFALKPGSGTNVLNRDLKYFKRHQPELKKEVEALQKFVLPSLGGKEENNFTTWAAAPGKKVFLAVATNYYQRFQKLVLTEAGGKTTVLNLPPEGKINNGLFATEEAQRRKQAAWKVHDVALQSDREFYFIFEDHEKHVQVWRSENAGQTWRPDTLLTSLGVYDLHFLTEKTGFALALDPLQQVSFLKTSDGGANWTLTYSGIKSDNLRLGPFPDEQQGWLVNSGQSFRKYFGTINGGISWNQSSFPTGPETTYETEYGSHILNREDPAPQVFTGSGNQLFVLTGGTVLEKGKAGENWIKLFTGLQGPTGINFYNSKTGIILLQNALLRTTNGGKSWIYYPLSCQAPLRHNGVEYIGPDKVLTFTDQGLVIYTFTD